MLGTLGAVPLARDQHTLPEISILRACMLVLTATHQDCKTKLLASPKQAYAAGLRLLPLVCREPEPEPEPEEELDDSNDRIIGLRLPDGLNVRPCVPHMLQPVQHCPTDSLCSSSQLSLLFAAMPCQEQTW